MLTGDPTTTLVHDRQRAFMAAAHHHGLAGEAARPSWIGSVRLRASHLLVQSGLRLASNRPVGAESCLSAAVLSRVRC